MSQSLIIRSFDKDGRLFAVPYIYASDLEGEPVKLSFEKTEPNELKCPLTEQPIFLNALWEVKGFGRLILTADNEGKGYSLHEFEINPVINLNIELARSHLHRVFKAYRGFISKGYNISKDVILHLKKSKKYLENAKMTADERNLAFLCDKSL